MPFFQEPPVLNNQYQADVALQSLLKRLLTSSDFSFVEEDLMPFGDRVVGDIWDACVLARQNEPHLQQFDAWGHRIDEIHTSKAWQVLGQVAAEEGMIALGYERRLGALSRIHQAAKLYLFNPASAIYTCPLAMSDGAARLIEVHGDAYLKNKILPRLTSRDPKVVWTSGQWMTERSGGSDVSSSETIAKEVDGGYALYGTKWFTSATTSQMAMTLARHDASAPLSLFFLETRGGDGKLNRIEIHRLKDKLGTRAMPTAELTMHGTIARMIGAPGRGVAQMATLFNVTRIYNAITSVGYMRRGLALAYAYAEQRKAFGKRLVEHPLHMRTLSQLQARWMASLHLVFEVARLQGKMECDEATASEVAALRLLTPVAKLFTAKESVAVLSEVLECFGGAGYIEDTHLPVLLRDAQVLPIWEGTTNVLSLDTLRAIQKEDAFTGWFTMVAKKRAGIKEAHLSSCLAQIDANLSWLKEKLETATTEMLQVNARSWAMTLGQTAAALALAEHAQWELKEKGMSSAAIALRLLVQGHHLQPAAFVPWDEMEKEMF